MFAKLKCFICYCNVIPNLLAKSIYHSIDCNLEHVNQVKLRVYWCKNLHIKVLCVKHRKNCDEEVYNNPLFRSPSRSQVYLQSSCSIDANWSSRIVRNLNFCNYWLGILHGSSPQNLLQYF